MRADFEPSWSLLPTEDAAEAEEKAMPSPRSSRSPNQLSLSASAGGGAHDDARASCCRTLSTASSYMDCCCWDVFLNSLKCLLDFWFCKCSQTAFREDGKTKSGHVERLSFLLQMVAPTSAFSRAVKLVAAVARSGLSGFASGMGAHCW